MRAVVADEYRYVPGDQARAGDIAVWTNDYDHSARFTKPVVTQGNLDPFRSELSTKNGQASLDTMPLSRIAGIYGANGIAVFRHK
jgi:hypothetical protein